MKKELLFLILAFAFSGYSYATEIKIYFDQKSPQVQFAVDELEAALNLKLHKVLRFSMHEIPVNLTKESIVFVLKNDTSTISKLEKYGIIASADLKKEGYSLQVLRNNFFAVLAKDASGLMYGGLELAEQILTLGIEYVKAETQNPYMEMRGTKFNIPLDVRTPSYTDMSDAAQQNIVEMWSFDFWKEYIDNLARYRYNYISLWNLHPFPSMVKVPKYPTIALNDVQRSTTKFNELYPLTGNGFDAPEIVHNVEVLKKISIDEKIDFWKKVMAYGKSRNVDFYIVTWNIFVNGTFGKYGITDHFNNETTTDYFRKSVEQMVLTYPDLAGIGLTTGENFHDANFTQKEDWAYNTYAKGVLDALEKQPNRKITFIHRQHQTGALDIAEKFKPIIDNPNINFIYSFKYAQAHVYSSTKQNFHANFVNDIKDRSDLKTIWTLRNDDVFYFRWGAPDFVREFIKNIPYDVSLGYYYGSDQYIWGREFSSEIPNEPHQIEIVKHWYQWMLWGRLGFNPNLENNRFKAIIATKFPQVNAVKLFYAWQNASMIYPITTGFHWGALDFQWYIEAGKSIPGAANTPTGFHDINRFISLTPHPATDYISIPKYVDALISNQELKGTTPIQVYQQIEAYADNALQLIEGMETDTNKELAQTLLDIKTMAYLGKYYASKIQASIDWLFFMETGDLQNKINVSNSLNIAALYWRMYTSLATSQNINPLWTNRVGYVDWKDEFSKGVLYDLTITGSDKHIQNMPITKGGTILEAENGYLKSGSLDSQISGFTGAGYVTDPNIEVIYSAKKEGRYVLEFRYGMKEWVKTHQATVIVNNQQAKQLKCYTTGGENNWVWDRLIVHLNAGENIIYFKAGNVLRLDHINVIPFY